MSQLRSGFKKGSVVVEDEIKTWGQALSWGIAELTGRSLTPKEDSLRLLTDCQSVGMMSIYQHLDKQIEASIVVQYRAWIGKRQQGWPIAYLTNRQDFWQYSFWVNQHVLIPRPESEMLVSWALERYKTDQKIQCLELGVGSGAVILSIAKEAPHWQCIGVDCSVDALAVSRRNQKRLGVRNIRLVQSDWFARLGGCKFDLIIANPPYIYEGDEHLVQGDVRFEPVTALTAGADGLSAIRVIVAESGDYLNLGGWIGIEHGAMQGQAVSELLIQAGFSSVTTLTDTNDLSRLTFGQWMGRS